MTGKMFRDRSRPLGFYAFYYEWAEKMDRLTKRLNKQLYKGEKTPEPIDENWERAMGELSSLSAIK